jgi:hypothetical protein
MASTPRSEPTLTGSDPLDPKAGWEAALAELYHQAMHLETRGRVRAAVTLYDAVRIAHAGGLPCEHCRPRRA